MSEQEEDFATLFEASVQAKPLRRGQSVEGTIVKIGPEVALVDVGGKSEAIMEVAELRDTDGVSRLPSGIASRRRSCRPPEA